MATTLLQAGGELTVGKFYRVAMMCYSGNQLGMCDTSWFIVSQSGTAGTLGGLAKAVGDAMQGNVVSPMTTFASILGWKCNQLSPPTPRPLSGLAADGSAGSDAGIPLPTQVRAILKFQTSLSGVAYRGRIFLPFWTDTYVTSVANPEINATGVGVINTIAASMLGLTTFVDAASGSTVAVSPVVYHRKTDTGSPITSAIGSKFLATQRRSGSYGRTNSTAPF